MSCVRLAVLAVLFRFPVRVLVIGLDERLEVVLSQEPERGPARRLLVGLKRELERAPLQHPKRMLLQCLVRVPVR